MICDKWQRLSRKRTSICVNYALTKLSFLKESSGFLVESSKCGKGCRGLILKRQNNN